MTDFAEYKRLPADERDNLGFARWREEQRQGTHMVDNSCHTWGPGHYHCALREIELLKDRVQELKQPELPRETPAQIAAYLHDLSRRMLTCGAAMEACGGLSVNMAARGLEMVGAAWMAHEWAEEIEAAMQKAVDA